MPMFNQIGAPRFSAAMVRLFGMKIPGAAAPSLAPEIAPSFDVNQQDDAQLFFLRGEQKWSAGLQIAAAVGNYGEFCLRNPATSGVLCVVERLLLNSTQAVGVQLVADPGDYVAVPGSRAMDSRQGLTQNCPVRLTTRNTVAVFPLVSPYSWFVPAGMLDETSVQFVISPGFALIGSTTAANVNFNLSLAFRVRQLPAEELATG